MAMHRGFREEADLGGLSWTEVAVLHGDEFAIHFFSAWTDKQTFDAAKAMTDEPLVRISTVDLTRSAVVPNLRVLIPLALDDTGIVKPLMIADSRPAAA
jgi:hypothetical protein